MRFTWCLPILSFWVASARADPVIQPSGDGCVDPAGLANCVEQENTELDTCVNQCDQNYSEPQDCIAGCGIYQHAAYIGCVVQSCWNQVYGCDFQLRTVAYFEAADLVASESYAPFYPTPAGVAGACSCNLGLAYSNLTSIPSGDPCGSLAAAGDLENTDYCNCCSNTLDVSSAINICPDTDLSVLNLSGQISGFASIQQGEGIDCSPILNSDTCATEFGFVLAAGSEFYNLLALPQGVPGTKAASDVGSFTTFPGPPTTTIGMFPGYTRAVTMAPWNADSGATTNTATGAQSTGSMTSAAGRESGKFGLIGLVAGLTAFAWL